MEAKWQTVLWERRVPMVDSSEYIHSENPDLSQNTVIVPATWAHTFSPEELALHKLRKRINEYEKVTGTSEWEYYKKIVNPYELIYTQKKYPNFPDSVCILHPLSRSYFKMIEMLGISDFFVGLKPSQKIRSAHVCEGPGGFIEGFLDQVERHKVQCVAATAITLKPRQPNVPGWKRASAFLQKHRNIRISYGSDGTGDLLQYENQNEFITTAGKVRLFTGDGGFDFSMNYDAQEQTIFPLLIASVRVGFEVLQEGGMMILKFFDTYYDGTKDLMYFLTQHFSKWTFYKPATSRPCNPEIYFIGQIFRPPPPSVLYILRGWSKATCFQDAPLRLFRSERPPIPLLTSTRLIQSQIAYLEKVFDLVESTEKECIIKQMLQIHEVISWRWCYAFGVPTYASRVHSIGALRTYLQGAGLLK
jgi:23S rRNA U2552 (ribose-2'-O)-methylase RlmE/FtsJ